MFFHILFSVFKGLLEMDGYITDTTAESTPAKDATHADCCPERSA